MGPCWVLVAAQVFLSLRWVGATLSLQCTGFSLRWPLFSLSMGTGACTLQYGLGSWGSGALERRLNNGLSCSVAWGVFPDQGLNSCLPHWLADSLPLSHQGSCLWFYSCLLVHFWLCWVSVAACALALVVAASGAYPLVVVLRLLVVTVSLLGEHDLGYLDLAALPGAGIKPVSPALADGFLTARPPGRSWARHS